MNVFDWNVIRLKIQDEQPTQDTLIKAAFRQYIRGNSCYEDMSSCELQWALDVFRASWIICENTLEGLLP